MNGRTASLVENSGQYPPLVGYTVDRSTLRHQITGGTIDVESNFHYLLK